MLAGLGDLWCLVRCCCLWSLLVYSVYWVWWFCGVCLPVWVFCLWVLFACLLADLRVLLVLLDFAFVVVLLIVLHIVILVYIARLYFRVLVGVDLVCLLLRLISFGCFRVFRVWICVGYRSSAFAR